MAKLTREQLAAKLRNTESVLQELIREVFNLKDLAIGTMELVKEFPDYEESLEKLKTKIKKSGTEKIESELELPKENKLEE